MIRDEWFSQALLSQGGEVIETSLRCWGLQSMEKRNTAPQIHFMVYLI